MEGDYENDETIRIWVDKSFRISETNKTLKKSENNLIQHVGLLHEI